MSALTISPPTVRPSDAPKSSAPPPGPSPGDFAALLHTTSARTAPAEGPKPRPSHTDPPRRDDRDDDDRQAEASRPGTVKSDDTAAQSAAAAAAARERRKDAADQDGEHPRDDQPADDEGTADPTAATAAAGDAAALAAAAALPALPGAAATAAAPGAPGTPGAPGQPGLPVAPAGAAPAAPTDPAAPGTPGDGKLQIPADLLTANVGAKAGHGHGDPSGGRPQPDLPAGAPPLPAADPTATAAATPAATPSAAAALPADAPAAAPVPAVQTMPAGVATAQPMATPTTAVPTAGGTPQLTRASVTAAADRVQDLVRIATMRSGNARATLQLKPAELGLVDVHLRTTRDGLVATIAAHSQSSLDALQSAGADLRRQLEDRGVQLHSLDLQLGAGDGGFTNQGDARQASSGGRSASRGWDLDGEDESAEDLMTITNVAKTPAGELVDVTA
jgi:hypothetical protein